MIEIILKIAILIWPFGQLLRYTMFGQNIYLLDMLLILLSVSLVFNKKSRIKLTTDKLSRYLLLFLITAGLSLAANLSRLSNQEILKASFYLLRLLIYPSIYFAVKDVNWNRIRTSVLSSITIFVIICIVQYVIFPDTTSLKYIGFDDHYYRLIGTFFDPNYTGLALIMVSLYFLSKSKYLYSFIFVPLIALTFSRATYLVFALGVFFSTFKKNLKITLLFLLILSLAVLISPKPFGEGVNLLRTFSIFSRFDSWRNGYDLFIQRPLFGWGYNTLTNLNGQRIGIDNSYIYLMATTGIFGISSFVLLLYNIIKNTKKEEYLVCLLVILLHSLFNNSLFFIWIYSSFWFIHGLSQRS